MATCSVWRWRVAIPRRIIPKRMKSTGTGPSMTGVDMGRDSIRPRGSEGQRRRDLATYAPAAAINPSAIMTVTPAREARNATRDQGERITTMASESSGSAAIRVAAPLRGSTVISADFAGEPRLVLTA